MMDLQEIKKAIQQNYGTRRVKYELPEDKLPVAVGNFVEIANEMLAAKEKTFNIKPVKQTVESLIKWAYMMGNDLDFRKGILLKGHTGRGKTFLFRVLKYFLQIDNMYFYQNGKPVILRPVIVNVKKIAGEFQSPDMGGYQVLQKYADMSCLVLDDIGKEQEESLSFGNRMNVVEEIINIREEKGLLTFGTTNLNRMSEMYDDRTVSRMHDLFNTIAIDHKIDFRK